MQVGFVGAGFLFALAKTAGQDGIHSVTTSRQDLRQRVYEACARIALSEGGIAAVTVKAVYGRTQGNRQAVTSLVRRWKAQAAAHRKTMPPTLQDLATRIAETAWILAKASLESMPGSGEGRGPDVSRGPGIKRPGSTPKHADQQVSDQAGDRRISAPKKSISDFDRPRDKRQLPDDLPERPFLPVASPSAKRRRLRQLQPSDWKEAKNPKLARKALELMNQRGFPLTSREIFDAMPAFSFSKAYRDLPRLFEGARIVKLEGGRWWIAGEPERPRPKAPRYRPVDTKLARRRRKAADFLPRALTFLQRVKRPQTLEDIWSEVKPPSSFRRTWLDHALRRYARKDPHLSVSKGLFRWAVRIRKHATDGHEGV